MKRFTLLLTAFCILFIASVVVRFGSYNNQKAYGQTESTPDETIPRPEVMEKEFIKLKEFQESEQTKNPSTDYSQWNCHPSCLSWGLSKTFCDKTCNINFW